MKDECSIALLSGTRKVPQLHEFKVAYLKQKAEIQAGAAQNDENNDEEDEGALVGDGLGFTFDDVMTAPRSPEREHPTDASWSSNGICRDAPKGPRCESSGGAFSRDAFHEAGQASCNY